MNSKAQRRSEAKLMSKNLRIAAVTSLRCHEKPVLVASDRSSVQLDNVPRNLSRSCITPSMTTDWHHEAICHFFDNYIQKVSPGRPTYLEILPNLYGRSSHVEYFSAALEAVSLSGLANQRRSPHLLLQARRCFGRAVKSLNKALDNTDEAKSDQALVTAFLISKYEVRQLLPTVLTYKQTF